jgi:hypothetical protein
MELLKRSMRLEPYYPDWVANALAFGHLMLGQHDQAKAIFKSHVEARLDNPFTLIGAHGGLAFIAVNEGDLMAAKGHMTDLRKVHPEAGASWYRNRLSYLKDKAFIENYMMVLRQAGLPAKGLWSFRGFIQAVKCDSSFLLQGVVMNSDRFVISDDTWRGFRSKFQAKPRTEVSREQTPDCVKRPSCGVFAQARHGAICRPVLAAGIRPSAASGAGPARACLSGYSRPFRMIRISNMP